MSKIDEGAILEQAGLYDTFHDWLKAVPTEDLVRWSAVSDDIDKDELKVKDQDTFNQIITLCIYFSGKKEVPEKELEDLWQMFSLSLALEINIREGKMTMEGHHSILSGNEAKFKMTSKGMKSVEDMIKDKE
jgi:hypothetical protein